MKRSELLQRAATAGLITAALPLAPRAATAASVAPISPIVPPAGGVNVAFLLSDGAVVIDFAALGGISRRQRRADAADVQSIIRLRKRPRRSLSAPAAKIVPPYALAGAPAPNVGVVRRKPIRPPPSNDGRCDGPAHGSHHVGMHWWVWCWPKPAWATGSRWRHTTAPLPRFPCFCPQSSAIFSCKAVASPCAGS